MFVPLVAGIRRFFLRLTSRFGSRRTEADLDREIRAHMRLLEDELVGKGMSPGDAMNAARRAFGSMAQAKDLHRDARSFRWLDSWWLDLKLGARLLAKYPGLTMVGGCAMALGIAFGASAFEVGRQLISPTIPLDDGDRIVAIRMHDAATASIEPRIAHDFVTWRSGLGVLEDVGAFRLVERNLAPEGESPEPIGVAEISASAFSLARVPPLLGRTLTADDEAAGADSVVVIASDVWRRRFASDPGILGRVVQLGPSHSTVVGVMPDGFNFPIAQRAWVPLRLRAGEYPPRGGPGLQVFARLADGVSLEQAQAVLTATGQRAAADFHATHDHLRPELLPYARAIFNLNDAAVGFTIANLFVVMFLALVSANVGALMFARTVTRYQEIAVRSALGATRGRIVMQLFSEALVLGAIAAVVGIAAGQRALEWLLSVSEADKGRVLPFWRHAELSPATILYACALTAVSAVLARVVPALKVTGGRLESQLRRSAVGDAGLKFGGMWTVVIVVQVAATVAFPAAAFLVRQSVVAIQTLDVGFPASRYLSARLELDAADAADPSDTRGGSQTAIRNALEELERRLTSEPLVAGVTFAERLPRTTHPVQLMELEALNAGASRTPRTEGVSRTSVAVNYFDVAGVPMLAGRSFRSTDDAAVIVNQSFVDRMLDGGNPIGRRVRYASSRSAKESRWYEIVGMVKDLGTIHDDPREAAGIYHPLPPDEMAPVHIVVDVLGDPASFGPRLRAVAAAVDPALRLYSVLPLDEVGASLWLEFSAFWRLLGVVSATALLLSLAGIYSIMSFTVSRRTREIGIRVALGASRWRVTSGILARALAQLSLGIVVGALLVLALTKAVAGLSAREVVAITAYVGLMTAVCLLACVVPVRRALAVDPIEALRTD